MYLVAHEDDCQMVVGTPSVDTVERVFNPILNEWMDCIVGTQQPRQCTCEPQKINMDVLLRMIGGTRHKVGDLYE